MRSFAVHVSTGSFPFRCFSPLSLSAPLPPQTHNPAFLAGGNAPCRAPRGGFHNLPDRVPFGVRPSDDAGAGAVFWWVVGIRMRVFVDVLGIGDGQQPSTVIRLHHRPLLPLCKASKTRNFPYFPQSLRRRLPQLLPLGPGLPWYRQLKRLLIRVIVRAIKLFEYVFVPRLVGKLIIRHTLALTVVFTGSCAN